MPFSRVATLALLALGGCYASHGRGEPAPRLDAGRDAGSRDAGFDASVDAGAPFVPPPGSCSPPPEQLRPRFPGDTQEERDREATRDALQGVCGASEGCGDLVFVVGDDGRVAEIRETRGDVTAECADEAVPPLCLPGLIDAGVVEVRICGV